MYKRQKNEIKKWMILNMFLCVISLSCSVLSLLYSTSLMKKSTIGPDQVSMALEESTVEELVESTELLSLEETCEDPIIMTTEEETTVPEESKTEEEIIVAPPAISSEDRELLAALVQAEAGNQDLVGMQYVVDVVLNRVDDPRFPNSIEGVIYEPNQFTVTRNGMLDAAYAKISQNAYLAVDLEWGDRLNDGILYFNSGMNPANGSNPFKHQDHWFGY